MNIFVCCKQVPDVEMNFSIKENRLITEGLNFVLNAYDASAVEAALVLKETIDAEVSLVLLGEETGREALRKGLAMGADNAFHINDPALQNKDSHCFAGTLAKFFADKEYDLILCGKQSQDTDMGLTGGILAGFLSIPFITNAVGLTIEKGTGKVVIKRQGDLGVEMVESPLPSIVACSNDMNEPRIPSLKGIMKSKRKPMEKLDLTALFPEGKLPEGVESRATVLSLAEPPVREAGERFEGTAEELVDILIDKLQNEVKIL
ncbi:electron transfer flavoprotein subunit beta/FixA family protein [Candidatus Riflebacteria bacterium]